MAMRGAGLSLIFAPVLGLTVLAAQQTPSLSTEELSPRDRQQQALSVFQPFVGQWRGVGQPQRGSNRGAWTEEASWAWDFKEEQPAIVIQSEQGKILREARLLASDTESTMRLLVTPPDAASQVSFSGQAEEDDKFVFTRDDEQAAEEPVADRVTFRQVADGDRLIILWERRLGNGDRYQRLAEVGYTRRGSSFGKGSNEPECVVTGGLGTIDVEYDGKTYKVCCTGCRDLFLEDPPAVLADYQARKAAEREKQKADK